ncbi:hypothetical protein SAMN02787118_11538 [Streptomyces mirabilis]|uniref:Uncharacterized protein n=1 Tax=Streptomyces mirabilis TaxID=68239 RepID=A0A1I2NKI4_9ACTN|nr:hypothetical protein SAMN02787118_11538 [Streptomyces mirabilis]
MRRRTVAASLATAALALTAAPAARRLGLGRFRRQGRRPQQLDPDRRER